MNVPSFSKVNFRVDKPMFGASSFTGQISKTSFSSPTEATQSFKQVMGNMVESVNDVVSKPDVLLRQAMTTGEVDIHDVMIANSKAELAVNLTGQFATKVIQAYDRILQIQV